MEHTTALPSSPGAFGMVPVQAMRMLTTRAQWATYASLSSWAGRDRRAHPSVAQIAHRAGIGERAVRAALAHLRRVGLVISHQILARGGVVGCVYRLVTPTPGEGPAEAPDEGPAEAPDEGPAEAPDEGPAEAPDVVRTLVRRHRARSAARPPAAAVPASADVRLKSTGRALDALGRLPVGRERLLVELRRIGAGDPWAGLMAARPALEASLDGSRDPGAVLLARLRRLVPVRTGSGAAPRGCSRCDAGWIDAPDGRSVTKCLACAQAPPREYCTVTVSA